jgi:hypothetical protein
VPPALPLVAAAKKKPWYGSMSDWAFLGLLATMFVPVFFPLFFFLFGLGSVLAAFVIAIVLLVRGQVGKGIAIIVLCPVSLLIGFAMMSFGFEAGTLEEKVQRAKQRQVELQNR